MKELAEVMVTDLTYRYPHSKQKTLKGVNLQVLKGEFIFITGRSGCGKSTLARTLNGTIPHILEGEMKGKVLVQDKKTNDHPVSEIAPYLGFIFQNPESQFFTLRVEDEVAFGPENQGLDPYEIHKRVNDALESVNMPTFRKRNVFQLSEGQKQRVAIAANLALNPDVLVLDEPTSNLDAQGAYELFQVLEKLKSKGKTIILIDHRTYYARKLADRILIMDNGRIVMEGRPELLDDPLLREKYGIRNPTSSSWSDSKLELKGDKIDEPKKKVLELKNICFQYGDGFRIENMSFSIYEKEILGILGDNGSGKTTLANLMAGLIKAKKGTINLHQNDEGLPLARKIGMVLQNPDHQLFMDSVYAELSFGLSDLGFSPQEIRARVENVINSMNLGKLRKRHPHSLSGGEKQRTLISALMARKPQILILDEPTTGMDDYHMKKLIKEVKDLEKKGVAVIIISHDLEFIQRTAERVIHISEGQIIEDKYIS